MLLDDELESVEKCFANVHNLLLVSQMSARRYLRMQVDQESMDRP